MSISLQYDDRGPGVVIEYTGTVEGPDILALVEDVFTDERFPTLRWWISDRSYSDRFDADVALVEKIVALTRDAVQRNPSLIMALVSPRDVDFGMSRMYEMLTAPEGFRTRVHRSREEAELWIEEVLDQDNRPISSSG